MRNGGMRSRRCKTTARERITPNRGKSETIKRGTRRGKEKCMGNGSGRARRLNISADEQEQARNSSADACNP